MGVTLAGQCTDSATSLCWLAMEYRGKWRWQKGEQLRNILQCKYYPNLLLWWSLLDYTHSKRQEQRFMKSWLELYLALKNILWTRQKKRLCILQTRQVFLSFCLQNSHFYSRGDNTQSLKGAILDWITPQGQALNPPLTWNKKDDHGFNHETTGALLCPIDLDWSDAE